jgi:protein SCO1/2
MGGGPLLLNFMFTSCAVVCPRQTRDLAAVRSALPGPVRERVRFLSISVDPENDGPSELKRFAVANDASFDGWIFASASAEDTERITARMAAFDPDAGARPAPSSHTTALFLFDGRGRLMQRYQGARIDVDRVAREIVSLDTLERPEVDVKNSQNDVVRGSTTRRIEKNINVQVQTHRQN